MRKKCLFVCTRQFWPTTTGKQVTLFYDCKGLCEECGYDIYLFCFADKNTDKKLKKPDFIHDVHYVDIPSKLCALKNILKYSLFGQQKWPFQNDLYYNEEIQKALLNYYVEVKPDVLIIDMVRLVPYIQLLKDEMVRKILIAEDDLAKRYRRQMESSSESSVTGYYAKNMSRITNAVSSMKFVKNAILKMEISRLETYEVCFTELFDNITFISPIETEEFNRRHRTSKAVTLTMGADVEYYAAGKIDEHKNRTLSFLGNYNFAPNAASIEMICRDIMPKLPEDVVLYVIGKCPDELKNKIEGPNVKVLGFVDDARSEVKSTDIFLSPIIFGTGIKTKIVEAMAMSMPIVTNSVGMESLNVKNGQELFICDTTEEIVDAVNKLLDSPELRKRMGENARKYAIENHDWSRIYEEFKRMGL